MSSKEENPKSPTDTNSAELVVPRWSLDAWLRESHESQSNTVKCSECKVPTLHEWIKFGPIALFETNDMIEIVSKARRLTCCTQCGLVKTIT